jgi:hypothetical protein
MNQTLRSLVSASVGGLVVAAVVVGQPALAGQLDKTAAKNSVTSKSIKNATIKTKDLSAEVTGPLAKAGTALQNVPSDSVGSEQVKANSLTNQDLADNSVTSSEITGNAVTSAEVNDHSLVSDDVATNTGTAAINFGSIGANSCDDAVIIATGQTSLAGDVIVVTPGFNFDQELVLQAQPQAGLGANILLTVCNWTGGAIDPTPTDFGWMVFEN